LTSIVPPGLIYPKSMIILILDVIAVRLGTLARIPDTDGREIWIPRWSFGWVSKRSQSDRFFT
jgi:hypothetical protein